jgi:hypothetical protein
MKKQDNKKDERNFKKYLNKVLSFLPTRTVIEVEPNGYKYILSVNRTVLTENMSICSKVKERLIKAKLVEKIGYFYNDLEVDESKMYLKILMKCNNQDKKEV